MLDLIRKYNTPTPRYTAYPPANYFSDTFSATDYVAEIEKSNEQGNPAISVYIHIPFCKQLCLYCGCNSYLQSSPEIQEAYFAALKKEMRMVFERLDPNRRISQIHYGGGTPNILLTSQLAELNRYILSFFKTIDSPEIAIECHPYFMNKEYIEGLLQAGFNRFSIGIQDFNEEVLKAVNRQKPALSVEEIMRQLRRGHPEVSINLDFIYGLPLQTVESFTRTIEEAITLRPDRLVTFSYAHVPWVNKNQQLLEKAGLPDVETKTGMYLSALDILKKSGYRTIGIDHYVLPDDELNKALQQGMLHRNFQGYCTRRTTGQVYAFGVSAISQFDHAYAQNTKSITDYIAAISDNRFATAKGYSLTREEAAIRTLLTGLMCNNAVSWNDMAEQTGYTVEQLKSVCGFDARRLDEFIADGIVTCSDEGIQITETGNLFTRNVVAALDPLLRQSDRKFSTTI